MVRMVCGQCKYSRNMSEREAEFGMLCPKCHCQYLRRPLKSRPGEPRPVRPEAIRCFVGGGVALFFGALLTAFGYNNIRSSGVAPRFFAYGIVIVIGGFV